MNVTAATKSGQRRIVFSRSIVAASTPPRGRGAHALLQHDRDVVFASMSRRRLSLPQRLHEHAIKAQLSGIAELRDPDGHSGMARRGLRSIGAEQAIPPRHVE